MNNVIRADDLQFSSCQYPWPCLQPPVLLPCPRSCCLSPSQHQCRAVLARRGAARVERSSRNIVTFAKFRLGIGIRLFHCPADPYQQRGEALYAEVRIMSDQSCRDKQGSIDPSMAILHLNLLFDHDDITRGRAAQSVGPRPSLLAD